MKRLPKRAKEPFCFREKGKTMYDDALLKKLFDKHYGSSHRYRLAMQEEYFELTGVSIPIPTLRDKIVRWRLEAERNFNEVTDKIIDEPSKLYTSEDLLEAMNIDPDGDLEFDRATVNRWWLDKGNILERIRNGQIKIHLTKKKFELNEKVMNELLEKANIKPFVVEDTIKDPMGLLEMTLTDMHFGNNDFEHYKEHQTKIVRWIKSQEWEEVLIPVGNDLFHWDNINGTTLSGTQVGFEPDINKAWEDATKFYFPIIEAAIENAIDVFIPYVRGNHDATLGWAFVKMLEKKYRQVSFDLSLDNYKLHTWEKVAIGLSHGDDPRDIKKYAPIFNELYRKEFAHAETREIHLGHKHHQIVVDEFGIITRGLSTAAETDLWHRNKGFVGASKAFQLFIYSKERVEAMIFI